MGEDKSDAREGGKEPSRSNDLPGPLSRENVELRQLWREVLLRLGSLYFVPLLLIVIFFNVQYRSLIRESEGIHLKSIAEQQAATLDLFFQERLVNISNIIDDPSFPEQPSKGDLESVLISLQQTSPTFVELALLNGQGRIIAYAGPHPSLGTKTYAREAWFTGLLEGQESYTVTDNYRGFRDQPHFTLAVKRSDQGEFRVLRAVLSPERIHEELLHDDGGTSIQKALVNGEGVYQVVDPEVDQPLSSSSFIPPLSTGAGTAQSGNEGSGVHYGYAWLHTSPWALVVTGVEEGLGALTTLYRNIIIFTAIFFLISIVVLWFHAKISVGRLWQAKQTQDVLSGQLVQAAKLASVGELAAGIAHEINNPLAVIAEEVGLLQDLMDPELGGDLSNEDLGEHLETMHEAVFRGRDITRKLLGFVRQTEVKIDEYDIHDIIDEVADGMLGHELELSNVEIKRDFGASPSKLITDKNQLSQVILNLMKNAVDAMGGNGILSLKTISEGGLLKISVADTGCGISREHMERVFQPFFTTKDPGKGTGLGLSVSQGIVESIGGEMYVDSMVCEGSTFTIELPLKGEKDE